MPEPWPYIYEKFLNVECILHSGDIHHRSAID